MGILDQKSGTRWKSIRTTDASEMVQV